MSEVAIIFGGPSPEHDVSVLTGLQAARELLKSNAVRVLYWSKTGEFFEVDPNLEAGAFVEGVPSGSARVRLVLGAGAGAGFATAATRLGRGRLLPIGVAVVCCHGGPGEDGTLQAVLDVVGIPYTGPTVASGALGMDKLAFTGVIRAAGLPALPRVPLHERVSDVGFEGPLIVKPRYGGSSIGIEVVADLVTALAQFERNHHWAAGAVVEPYRADLFDLQIAVRSWPELQLSAIERPLRTSRAGGLAPEPEILGYADKYVGGEGMASAPRELPARIDPSLASRLRDAAVAIAELGLVRGVARIDFLSDGTELLVNELNTIPGSLARHLWLDPVVPFATLLRDLMAEATNSPTHRYTTQGADGTVLRGASSIAAKLA